MRAQGLPRVAGDMRRLPFADDSFDWVLNFFTSFGYFETRARELPGAGGDRARPRARRPVPDRPDEPGAAPSPICKPRETQELTAGREVEIERWYDAASQRINKRIA